MIRKRPLYKVPVHSTEFEPEAHFCLNTIRFGYYQDGRLYRAGIAFNGLLATRSRSERCCTEWNIEEAYDTLVEIEESSWVRELRADTDEQWRDYWEMHHYMIYLDSAGCFELIAHSWNLLPVEEGTWNETLPD